MTDKQITDLAPGTKYYVSVRAKKRLTPSVMSDWSKPFAFTTTGDLIAPKPVTGLTFVSEGTSFIAKWNAPTQNADNTTLKDLKGYNIRFINADNTSETTITQFTPEKSFTLNFDLNQNLFGLAKGHLTAEVRAVDLVGNISTPVTATAQNPVPADVTNLTSDDLIEAINLNWDRNDETDLAYYEVYVSTVSAGFTPAPANRRYQGPNNTFTLTTANPVVHHIKVCAVDVFGQQSANFTYISDTPRTTTSTDGTPPGGVSSLVVTTTADGLTADIKADWEAPADLDIDHYVVRYATDTTNWSYLNVPPDVTEAVIKNLLANKAYYVGVKTVDYSANSSAWVNANVYPITTAADTAAPNKPSPPSVATSVLKAQITHDMNDSVGADLAADTEFLEVYADTASDFTPQPGNQVTKIATVGPGVAVSELVTYPTATALYWKVIAVDNSGNKSVASDATLGTPGLLANAYIENATITDAKIADLSAAKLTAGSAFINDLFIRSELTIDNANGYIQSDDYNVTNRTGWKIDRNGIVIYEGAVKATALEIQDSQNILPSPFADFQFNAEYYYNATNVPNTVTLSVSAATSRLDKVLTGSKYGDAHIRFYDATGAADNWLHMAPSGQYNIPVDGGNTYIISAWVKNNIATPKTFNFGLVTDVAGPYIGSAVIPGSSGWTRVSMIANIDINATKAWMSVGSIANTPFDFALDGLQVERKIGSLDTPSPWTPPGNTTIAGESIITGSIRSSANAAGVSGQPAWSLNTAGNAQFGDALVRGSLVVGAGADLSNSVVKSSSYSAGTTGWIIKGDGSVEFNSGVFRGDMSIERTTNGLTTNLKADVGIQRFQINPYVPASNVDINTPIISGQHYGYSRQAMILEQPPGVFTNFWSPATPSASRKMRYFFGPTSEKSIMLQTNDLDNNFTMIGNDERHYPLNTLVNSLKLGELPDYLAPQSQSEPTGYKLESVKADVIGNLSQYGELSYTYTRTDYAGGIYRPYQKNVTKVVDYAAARNISPFSPEYVNTSNTDGTYVGTATDFNSNTTRTITAASQSSVFNKNLMREPYCSSLHSTLTFDNVQTYNDLVGTASSGQVQVTGTANNMGVTATVEAGMYTDTNYKTPAYLVNWSVNQNSASKIYFTNNMTGTNPSTWFYPVHSIRRGKTYILSIFMRSDMPGSGTSGVQGPPTANFNVKMGLRCRTSGTTPGYIDVEGTVTAQANKSSIRLSVAVTPPAGTPELNSAIFYMEFPGQALLNRYVMITHPQVEEKIWTTHPNPIVAASNYPTSWSTGDWYVYSENSATITAKTLSTGDLRYEAYGRNARGNQLFSDKNTYQVVDYKVYREAPAYVDISLIRNSQVSGGSGLTPYAGDTNTSIYRFSEAGLMFPTSHEPYMPAGIQQFMNNRFLPAGGGSGGDKNINLSEHAYDLAGGTVQVGFDVRIFNSTTGYVIDRAGFYLMTLICKIDNAGADAMWFEWKVTQAAGTFTLGKSATGRTNVWEQTSTIMRYLNRDDIITPYLWTAQANMAGHNVSEILICIARIN